MKKIKLKPRKEKEKKLSKKQGLIMDMSESTDSIIFDLCALYLFKDSLKKNEPARETLRKDVYNSFCRMPVKKKNKQYSEKFIRKYSWGIYDGRLYPIIVDVVDEYSFNHEIGNPDITIAEIIDKCWVICSHYFDWLIPELAKNGEVTPEKVEAKLVKMGL